MTRLAMIGTLAAVVLAAALGLIFVMDQDQDDPPSQVAGTNGSTGSGNQAPTGPPTPPDASSTEAAATSSDAVTTESKTAPSFDVVRINPSGDAVIAGRAQPGDMVTILDGDEAIGSVEADDRGEWVFLPNGALSPGEHNFTLQAGPEDAPDRVASTSGVLVVVPEIAKDIAGQPSTKPAGALAIQVPLSGKGATKILNLPGSVPGAADEESGPVSIQTIDYDDSGQAVFSGQASPGARVIVYLNNQPVGEAKADAAGHWSIDQVSPVGKGPHRLRVDMVDETGKVAGRAEVEFQQADVAGASGLTADGSGRQVIVQPGNNLWVLARHSYGQGPRYTIIYEANKDQITDPDLIYPGQVLMLPSVQ